jgi:predicted AAA+ superfamily ATPase
MIPRRIAPFLLTLASEYPVLVVTGPRQSGKTTLCRALFPEHAYVNLEPSDNREFAQQDPRGFLARYDAGAVIDEIQHAPELTSYLQAIVDDDPTPGRFILTGSENLTLTESVSQSLAGRSGMAWLLPLSAAEMAAAGIMEDRLWDHLLRGGYPRILDRGLAPGRWLQNYTTAYLERDVRSVLNVGDLNAFRSFLALAAGRTACEVNYSGIGGDAGVSHNTARSWLSVLQAGFLVHLSPAWHRNLRKQLVRSPKLHWLDSGLLCALLGIRDTSHLELHPLRGAIFESWVFSELLKARLNAGLPGELKHFRESRGLEIDILIEDGLRLTAVECKSGATVHGDQVSGLQRFQKLLGDRAPELPAPDLVLAYGGRESVRRGGVAVTAWQDVGSIVDRDAGH